MIDAYGRAVHYLRISVTDRCNLRCCYCMPEHGVELLEQSQLLSYEEILAVTREAVGLGFNKCRLTGGEPLVRRNIIRLVEMLSELEAISDLAMTTNGTLLEQYARPLRAAGLHRLNISLDTLDALKFMALTRGGELAQVIRGIRAALECGFRVIKINCVVRNSSQEPDALAVAAFGMKYGLQVRFIRSMDLAHGKFWVVEGGAGGDCQRCNRLRLSSNGQVRPCLFSDIGFSVRELGAKRALLAAIAHKPRAGNICRNATFNQVGG